MSKLKQAVNRLRKMKRQLEEATGHLGKGERALKNRAEGIVRKLSAIESVMVDPHRKSVRDVLRNPAGLNDTLLTLTVINAVILPLTFITGLYGMNVKIPMMPGGDGAQFWDVVVLMVVMSGGMIWYFRRRGWV